MFLFTIECNFTIYLQVVRQKVLPKEREDYVHLVNPQINHLHDGMPKN